MDAAILSPSPSFREPPPTAAGSARPLAGGGAPAGPAPAEAGAIHELPPVRCGGAGPAPRSWALWSDRSWRALAQLAPPAPPPPDLGHGAYRRRTLVRGVVEGPVRPLDLVA